MKTLAWLLTLLIATSAAAQISYPTDREAARRVSEAIATALNERDGESLSSLFDFHAFGMRAGNVQGMQGQALRDYAARFETEGEGILAVLLQRLEVSPATVSLLRVMNTGATRAMVRLDGVDGASDYLEFVLETRSGRTRAIDWFQLSAGELMSVTEGGVGRLFRTGNTGPLARAFGIGRVDESAMRHWARACELRESGKYAESLAELQRLPEPIASTRVMLTFQSSMAKRAQNNEEHARILTRLAEKYSDDPAAAFLLLEHYAAIGDLPNMLRSLDTMEKRVGIDGVTRNYRAAAFFSGGDYVNTLKFADEAIGIEPTLVSAHDTRASALIGLGRYSDAVAQYQTLAQRFGYEFERQTFKADPFYERFVESTAFREWLPK